MLSDSETCQGQIGLAFRTLRRAPSLRMAVQYAMGRGLQMLKNPEWQARRIRGIGLDGRTEMDGVDVVVVVDVDVKLTKSNSLTSSAARAKQTWFGASQGWNQGTHNTDHDP